MTLVFDWSKAGPDEQNIVQIARYDFAPGQQTRAHTHSGYAEATWVIEGGGRHLRGGGETLALGDLLFIGERDEHAFAAGPEGLSVVNAAIALPFLIEVRRRLGGLAPWPWDGPRRRVALGPDALGRLSAWSEELAPHRIESADAVAFIADLVRLPERADRRAGCRPPPLWLNQALRDWRDQGRWAEGPGELARACGRTPDHLNRTVRAAYGCTTALLLQRLRLDRAAALLRLTERSVLDIALAVGCPNQGHFHRAFKRRFATTPFRYRRRSAAV